MTWCLRYRGCEKEVAVQTKDQAFNRKERISVTNFVTELQRACDFLRIQEGAEDRFFWELMNGPAFTANKERYTQSSNDTNMHKSTITIYAEVWNHLLKCYATDDVIKKAGDEVCRFRKGSLTPRDYSQNVWDLTIHCSGVHN